MTPLHHKILIGVIASVAAAGIAATSGIIIANLQSSARIEAKVEDIATDFDNFTNIRYQQDLEDLTDEIARVNQRIDESYRP